MNTDREVVKVKTILGVEPPAIILFFILFLYFLGMAGILSFTTLYAKTRGFRIEYIGLFYFIISGGIFIARLLLGRVVDKRGGDIIVIPCTIIVAICLFLIPRAPSLLILICLALPYGIANGAVVPALNAALFKRCSPNRRGAVSATYFIAVDLGITVGTPVMGLIVDHIDFSWVYWLSAIFSGMSVLLYVLFGSDMQYERRQKKKRSHGTAIV